MINKLLLFQNSYSQEYFPEEKEEYCQIHQFLKPISGKIEPTVGKQLYNRFVVVERGDAFVAPSDEVYQKNFKTLWTNTQRLQKRLNTLEEKSKQELVKIQENIEKQQKKIRKKELKKCGTYMMGNYTKQKPAYELSYGSAPPYYYEELDKQEKALEKAEEKLEQKLRDEVLNDIEEFVTSAVLDKSFLLIHDLITLIDTQDYYTGLSKEAAFCSVKDKLKCDELVKNNIEKLEEVKGCCNEIQELKIRLSKVMKKNKMHTYAASEKEITSDLSDLLRRVLLNEVENQKLINFIVDLDLIKHIDLRKAVEEAFKAHINTGSVEKAQKILKMKLLDFTFEISILPDLFKNALERRDLNKAQLILKVNEGESPLSVSILKYLFVEAVTTDDDVELLKFIHQLADDKIPPKYMKEAIKKADEMECPKIQNYLKPYKSKCAIM